MKIEKTAGYVPKSCIGIRYIEPGKKTSELNDNHRGQGLLFRYFCKDISSRDYQQLSREHSQRVKLGKKGKAYCGHAGLGKNKKAA